LSNRTFESPNPYPDPDYPDEQLKTYDKPSVLQEVQVPVVNVSECRNLYLKEEDVEIDQSTICAVTKGQDACGVNMNNNSNAAEEEIASRSEAISDGAERVLKFSILYTHPHTHTHPHTPLHKTLLSTYMRRS
jgi:hypothetical protein